MTSKLSEVAAAIRSESDQLRKKRLRVVMYFLKGQLIGREIAAYENISPASAYDIWKKYREGGISRVTSMRSIGRPKSMPKMVFDRFHYLGLPEQGPCFIYVIEREIAIFKALGENYNSAQLNRWLRQFFRDQKIPPTTIKRFRKISSAVRFMDIGTIMLYQPFPKPNASAQWQKRIRLDVLRYTAVPESIPEAKKFKATALASTPEVYLDEAVQTALSNSIER